MSLMEAVREAIKELVLPELASLRASTERVESRLTVVEKGLSGVERRLDDVNLHLVDQSRRIDTVRAELSGKDDEINKRLDRLYEIIVRRDEHVVLAERIERLESEVSEIKRNLAA